MWLFLPETINPPLLWRFIVFPPFGLRGYVVAPLRFRISLILTERSDPPPLQGEVTCGLGCLPPSARDGVQSISGVASLRLPPHPISPAALVGLRRAKDYSGH